MSTPPPGLLLRLSPAVLAAICAHAEQAYPDECCGALVGVATAEGWRVQSAVRAKNIYAKQTSALASDADSRPDFHATTASARSRYQIAPAELVQIVREARRQGQEIAGFYHSHPGHPAHWSPTDLAEAHWLGCCYLIVSVVEGEAAETVSFLLAGEREEDKRFEPQRIMLE